MTPKVGADPRPPFGPPYPPSPVAPAGWTALGAPVQFVVTEAGALESGRAILKAELTAMDAVCSGRPGSELAGLGELAAASGAGGGAGGAVIPVSSLLADAIAAALRTARLTGGDVDPTVGEARDGRTGPGRLDAFPGQAAGWQQVRLDHEARRLWMPAGLRLDLSATVTAWAADRCAGRLARKLGCGVLVGLGGRIAVAGQAPPGGWRIRIQDANGAEDAPATVVAIHDGGLATSSTAARRRGHDPLRYILDPRAVAPAAPFWRTVSVAAVSCAFASAASTAAMIRGRHAKRWLASLGLPARMVALDGRVHTVAGWPAGG
jgi:thiamine biosynthesis lipoprotein